MNTLIKDIPPANQTFLSDKLSSIIKGNLSNFYNEKLTHNNITPIASQITECIEKFLNEGG